MKNLKVSLTKIEDVKKFCSIVNRVDYDVDIVAGKYVVDAKSIMGIFSLDLSKPLSIKVNSDDCQSFLNDISEFVTD